MRHWHRMRDMFGCRSEDNLFWGQIVHWTSLFVKIAPVDAGPVGALWQSRHTEALFFFLLSCGAQTKCGNLEESGSSIGTLENKEMTKFAQKTCWKFGRRLMGQDASAAPRDAKQASHYTARSVTADTKQKHA